MRSGARRVRKVLGELADEVDAEGPGGWLWLGGGVVAVAVLIGAGIARLLGAW